MAVQIGELAMADAGGSEAPTTVSPMEITPPTAGCQPICLVAVATSPLMMRTAHTPHPNMCVRPTTSLSP